MANYYNLNQLETVVNNWAAASSKELSIGDRNQSTITCVAGGTEMIRVAEDGFYIRGQKVPADDREAEQVYNAFKEFLVWSRLHRD
jgi:hypothetical protein